MIEIEGNKEKIIMKSNLDVVKKEDEIYTGKNPFKRFYYNTTTFEYLAVIFTIIVLYLTYHLIFSEQYIITDLDIKYGDEIGEVWRDSIEYDLIQLDEEQTVISSKESYAPSYSKLKLAKKYEYFLSIYVDGELKYQKPIDKKSIKENTYSVYIIS